MEMRSCARVRVRRNESVLAADHSCELASTFGLRAECLSRDSEEVDPAGDKIDAARRRIRVAVTDASLEDCGI